MPGGRVRGVAVGCALMLAVPVAVAAEPPPDPASASSGDLSGEVPAKRKLAKHVVGKVQVARGARVKAAPVRVETLKGKKLTMPTKTRTSVGGGVFFPAKGLPTRFVVVIDGTDRKKSQGQGHLRAFVDRRDKSAVQISFGTTVAVRTYRLAKGKWSIKKSTRRAVKALKLPKYTQLGFDDRVNPVYVSRKVLLDKSGGKLDGFTTKVARRAYSGKKGIKVYTGDGPLAVRRSVGTLLHPRGGKRTSRAAGFWSGLGSVFELGSTLYPDIAAKDTNDELSQVIDEMTALNQQMDELSTQLSNVQTAVNNGFAQLAAEASQNNYNSEVASWDSKDWGISEVYGWFEAIQTTPCPGFNNCSSATVNENSYNSVLSSFGPTAPPPGDSYPDHSAPGLVDNADSMGEKVFDFAGAQGLMTSAWNLVQSETAAGNNPLTSNPDFSPTLTIPFTGWTQPTSDEANTALNYWYAQLEQVMLFGINYQDGPDPDSALNIEGLNNLVYNMDQSYQLFPSVVPDGMVYDPSINVLWANFGLTWLNDNPTLFGPPPSPPTGTTFNLFDVSIGGNYTALPGSEITVAQAQDPSYSWQIPQVINWYMQGVSAWFSWGNSPQLGVTNPNQGLSSLFPQATPNSVDVWGNVAALPVTDSSKGANTFSPLLNGLSGAVPPAQFDGSGAPIWVAWSQSGWPPSADTVSYGPIQSNGIAFSDEPYACCQLPTSTPNLLLYTPVPANTYFAWDGYEPVANPNKIKPTAPQNVTATAGDAFGQATVSWDPPVYSGSSNLINYTATANAGGGSCTVDVPTTQCTITGLTAGQSYTFTVVATNAGGSSGPSKPSNAVVPIGLPAAPTNVTAVSGPGDNITISWNPPPGASTVTGYQVNLVSLPNVWVCSVPAANTSCAAMGPFAPGTSYQFKVAAVNAYGLGPWSYSNVWVAP